MAVAVLVFLFVLAALLSTVSVKVELPTRSAAPPPPTASEWLGLGALLGSAVLAICLLIVLLGWLVVQAARKIVRANIKDAGYR